MNEFTSIYAKLKQMSLHEKTNNAEGGKLLLPTISLCSLVHLQFDKSYWIMEKFLFRVMTNFYIDILRAVR